MSINARIARLEAVAATHRKDRDQAKHLRALDRMRWLMVNEPDKYVEFADLARNTASQDGREVSDEDHRLFDEFCVREIEPYLADSAPFSVSP